MPIHTDRLTLRLFLPEDFAALRQLDRDPEVLRYRSRKHISPESSHEFLDRAWRTVKETPRRLYAYAVVLRRDASWLGQCGLTVLAPDPAEAFAWYSLLPRYWGQGYMSEAVRALLVAGFTEFGLQRIVAECHPDNRASIRVMEKAGMQLEGRLEVPLSGGGTQERIRYGLAAIEAPQPGPVGFWIEPPL